MNLNNQAIDNDQIKDIREPEMFKTFSFSGFKKLEVKNCLIHSKLERKIEDACFWSAELICAGHFLDLWEVIFLFLGKYIHLGNPLLIIYIKKKLQLFKVIVKEQYGTGLLNLRNNLQIRELFAEIVSTMSLSDKKPSYEELKISEVQDISQMTNHLRADYPHYSEGILQKDDPKEMTIPINELCFHLQKTKNMNLACFWIEWILEFENLCKRRKELLLCEKRTQYEDIENKYKKDIIWLIWETLSHSCSNDSLRNTLINNLFDIFRTKYSKGTSKRRKSLLYFAVSIITENANLKKEILTDEKDKEMVQIIKENVGKVIYKEIKKGEILTMTENSTITQQHQTQSRQNFQNSINKLQLIKQLDFTD